MLNTPTRYSAVLFDLDGTLLDTAADLSAALNAILHTRKIAPLSIDQTRQHAGRGSKGLLKLALNVDESHPDYLSLVDEFLTNYGNNLLTHTQLFTGMNELLLFLESNQIPWGIVTNKPHRFTSPLVEALHLTSRAACIVSGDTLAKRKPDADTLLHACELLQIKPENCLYVGDSEIDVIASRAAGMDVLVALYGYIPETSNPYIWQADGYIQSPVEIIPWLSRPS